MVDVSIFFGQFVDLEKMEKMKVWNHKVTSLREEGPGETKPAARQQQTWERRRPPRALAPLREPKPGPGEAAPEPEGGFCSLWVCLSYGIQTDRSTWASRRALGRAGTLGDVGWPCSVPTEAAGGSLGECLGRAFHWCLGGQTHGLDFGF